MFASLLIGSLGVVGICAALTLFVHVHDLIVKPSPIDSEPIVTQYAEPVRKKQEVQVNLAPQRMITVTSGPSTVKVQPPESAKESPKFVKSPDVAEPQPDLLVFEESEFDMPFEEEAKPVKVVTKAPPTQRVVRNTTPPKPRGPSQAELERRERIRLAGLARKIVQNATIVSRPSPSYPKSARRKGQQGQVVVLVTVSSSGKVSGCQISKSSGHSLLDSAALSAARRCRFRPAKNGLGQSVSMQKRIPYSFQLAG